MSATTAAPAPVALPTIPLLQIGPWVVFFGLLAMIAIFFVSASQGALALPAGDGVHEWVHDARHLLGFPCH
ncbi:CbtB-domain containing protein [Nocardioides panacisoli]|uniref:CbtB domain-containing protein n=1 Tax=Nocardioides panacisoli TaxID=627624 RepID=UPI001C62C05E|nr:CbtB-domain containing protein [Nocardioides panacisoli]QYJ05474.1 CbtB-domain containing protein [Nocardioides panacisoli]